MLLIHLTYQNNFDELIAMKRSQIINMDQEDLNLYF